MKRMQNTAAFQALREVQATLRFGVGVPLDQLPLVEDLLARIERALAPYFEH